MRFIPFLGSVYLLYLPTSQGKMSCIIIFTRAGALSSWPEDTTENKEVDISGLRLLWCLHMSDLKTNTEWTPLEETLLMNYSLSSKLHLLLDQLNYPDFQKAPCIRSATKFPSPLRKPIKFCTLLLMSLTVTCFGKD